MVSVDLMVGLPAGGARSVVLAQEDTGWPLLLNRCRLLEGQTSAKVCTMRALQPFINYLASNPFLPPFEPA
jgi:hypothetical protein